MRLELAHPVASRSFSYDRKTHQNLNDFEISPIQLQHQPEQSFPISNLDLKLNLQRNMELLNCLAISYLHLQ